jgi:hypothetical protein
LKYALEQGIQWSAIFGGAILTLVVAGVTLHIDRKMECYFIQVDPAIAERPTVRAIERLAERLGFEVMPEWECPAEVQDNGTIRHWMAEKEVLHDRSSVQAV